MDINYSFYIRVDENGERKPIMVFFPSQYEMLSHLGELEFSNSINVSNLLDQFKKTVVDKLTYSFSSDDWCIVTINGDTAKVENGFGEFESFELSTEFIYKLMNDWRNFLIKYETNQIPGFTR